MFFAFVHAVVCRHHTKRAEASWRSVAMREASARDSRMQCDSIPTDQGNETSDEPHAGRRQNRQGQWHCRGDLRSAWSNRDGFVAVVFWPLR